MLEKGLCGREWYRWGGEFWVFTVDQITCGRSWAFSSYLTQKMEAVMRNGNGPKISWISQNRQASSGPGPVSWSSVGMYFGRNLRRLYTTWKVLLPVLSYAVHLRFRSHCNLNTKYSSHAKLYTLYYYCLHILILNKSTEQLNMYMT